MSVYERILVTGGCGFIGSHFIREVLQSPDTSVVNIDVLTYAGNPANLDDVIRMAGKRYQHKQVDICDVESIAKIFVDFQPQVVVHFAAESHVDRSYFNAFDFVRTNIEGTRALLEAAKQTSSVKRFVHISTDEVYGDISQDAVSVEDDPFRPSSLYAASKAGADLLAQSFFRTHSFPLVILRGSNNYGTHQYPEKLIPMALTSIFDGKTIALHGDGTHQRTWLHVNDFVSAILLVMHEAQEGSVWNVSGETKSNLEVLQTVADIMKVQLEENIVRVPDRPGADFRYAPSSDKIRTQLGWEPKHHFSESIKDIIDWYMKNDDWWRAIRDTEAFAKHFERQASGKWF